VLINAREFANITWLWFCQFYGIAQAMKTTIDAAGRIVIPKAVRQALGLKPGQPLEIRGRRWTPRDRDRLDSDAAAEAG
jgi:AbrB family looped-hinge helix DNA binding protein